MTVKQVLLTFESRPGSLAKKRSRKAQTSTGSRRWAVSAGVH